VPLRDILTISEPLGPLEQDSDHDGDSIKLLLDHVTPFDEAIRRMPVLLLGRKGSGKSSILMEVQAQSAQLYSNSNNSAFLPPRGQPVIILLNSWLYFHQMVRRISSQNQLAVAAEDPDLEPVEYYGELWQEVIWDEIIKHFHNFQTFPEARSHLTAVQTYMQQDGHFTGPAAVAAQKRHQEARAAVTQFVRSRNSRIIFLFDSMESYPVRNHIFMQFVGGLFIAIKRLRSPTLSVTFCLPEEIEAYLSHHSSNIMKDFGSLYRIKWKPIDLLKVVAHRYRLAIEIFDPEFYAEIEDLDFDTRDGVRRLFNEILPPTIENRLRETEDTLAYIIRHTQLLPRHAIAAFNFILSKNYLSTNSFRSVTEESVKDGVSEAERLIAAHILFPYETLYPKFIVACRDILPELHPIVQYNELTRIENRFKLRIEEDVHSVWHTLYNIGALGRVVDRNLLPSSRDSRYCLAEFHFNSSGTFGFSRGETYCFHPVFTQSLRITRKEMGDKRAIYPSNVKIFPDI
jgi:hypothetical protein